MPEVGHAGPTSDAQMAVKGRRMQADLIMVIGVTIAFFAVPALVYAWSEGEAPRSAAVFLLIGLALGFYATTVKPGGFDLMDIPLAFVVVAGDILN